MTENNSPEIFTKEEFLKKLNEFEEKWMKMLDIKDNNIQKEITNLKENSNDILKKSKIIMDNYTTDKMNESKINDLESFRNKVNDILIAHEVRINNNIKDLNNFTNKYDKMISENIYVPGFIGPSCQYKSLSEYINYNMNEVSKIRLEKDIIKNNQKETKTKIDNFMKQMLLLNETAMTRSREYINGKQKDYELLINAKISPLNDKIFKFYESSLQFQSKVENEVKKFREDLVRILKNKEELLEIINEKETNLKNNLDNLYKKVIMVTQDIGINKNKILEIKEEIKGINNSYDKLNTKITEILKEMNNNSIINKKNQKDLRHSVAAFSTFKNKLDKNKISITPRTVNKDNNKNSIINKTETTTEREIKEEEEEKNNEINIKENITINTIYNSISEENNNNMEKIRSKSIKQKIDNKNEITKNKYKSIYNKMIKENDNDEVLFETFYLGNTKIPIITKPFLLDQRILTDEEMRRIYKEKKEKIKEKEKMEKIRKSFLNNNLNNKNKNKNNINNNININNDINIIKGNNLNISLYKTSIPKLKLTNNKKSDDKIYYLTHFEKRKKKELNKKGLSLEKINNKINNMKYLNLVNLKLDDSSAINPDTNNGAYILAKKQLENCHNTRLNITPTSYAYVYDTAKGLKASKLVSMNFMKEERKIFDSFNNTFEKEEIKNKLEINDLCRNVRFNKDS